MSSDEDSENGDPHEAPDIEAEARALVRRYNEAEPNHAPALDWQGMHFDPDSGDEGFVLEASGYIGSDGLDALRACGRTVRYIEAYEYDGEVRIQIEVPVQHEVPDE